MNLRQTVAVWAAAAAGVGWVLVPMDGVLADPGNGPARMDAAVRLAAGLEQPTDRAWRLAPLRRDSAGRVVVYVDGPDPAALKRAVHAVGGAVSDAHSDRVRAAVPPDALRRLAAGNGVDLVHRPETPVPMAITSEGVQASHAHLWHADGRGGASAKVGLLDVGFGRLDAAQAQGELPAGVSVYNGNCGTEHGSSHGTTVAEVVHDMAPDAQLFLACVTDSMDFDDAARWLRWQGVHVINVSMGFPGTGRGNGLPGSTAGDWSPATTVAWLRHEGVLVVAAAGNEADKHWTARTADPEDNNWMNISGASETLSFALAANATVTVELKWDAWPRTDQNLDLYVSSSPSKPTGVNDPAVGGRYSIRPQHLTEGGLSPVELVTFTNTESSAATYWVYVQRVGGPRTDMRYDLTMYGKVSGLSYRDPSGSIAEPATSPYVLAVGAITPDDAATGGAQASYSSEGPTIDGRVKPDLVGFTNVSTYTGGVAPNPTKNGTSIAAAHVSGAAAVLKGANPDLDAGALQHLLLDSTTREQRTTTMGYGVLNLGPSRVPQAAGGSAFTPLVSPRTVLHTVNGTGGKTGPFKPGEVFVLRVPDLPPDATAVVLNIVGSFATAPTALTVYGKFRTETSTLHAVPDRQSALMAVVALDPVDKVVRIHNSAADVTLSADMLGYFSPDSSANTYVPTQRPVRLQMPDPFVGAGQAAAVRLPVRGVSGIPTNATAVMVTVTVTESTASSTRFRVAGSGWPVWAFPVYRGVPTTYSYLAPIGEDGAIRVGHDAGTAKVSVDVNGWFISGTTGARYVPLLYPGYAFHTATGTLAATTPSAPGWVRSVQVSKQLRMPDTAAGAVLSLSAPRADARTKLSLWPDEYGWSGTPTLATETVQPADTTPAWPRTTNTVVTALGASGVTKVRNYTATADVAVGIHGYFVGGTAAGPSGQPLQLGLWEFEEASGSTAYNRAIGMPSDGHHATLYGQYFRTDGVRPDTRAVEFQYGHATTVSKSGDPVIYTDQDFTVSAWTLLNKRGGAVLSIAGNTQSGFLLQYLSTDRWAFTTFTTDEVGATPRRAVNTTAPPLNTWIHLAGVYDASERQLRLYVNGALAGVADGVTTWRATGSLHMGNALVNDVWTGHLAGRIDSVQAYRAAMTDSQILRMYAGYGVID